MARKVNDSDPPRSEPDPAQPPRPRGVVAAPTQPAPAPPPGEDVTAPTASILPDGPRPRPAGLPATAPLAPGDRVGRFSVIGPLGAGGMGVVYAAQDPELDRRVAIKLLGTDRERSREASLRLLREAQAMARLSHPNVVPIFDVGELEGGSVFLAMEYIDGRTLDKWLAAERRGWRQIVDVLVQAGRGVAAAHQAGLVHRDFKPGNVLVDGRGRARVTDFGIARLGEGDEQALGESIEPVAAGVTPLGIALTRTGAAVGTPAYMAPEQERSRAVDPRADQFSFCVTLWEALYGERPFAGSGPDLARAIAEGEIGAPRGDRDVPAWIAPLVRRGLAAAPADRWPSMDALLDRLADDPEARRRRRLAIGGALVVAAAVAAGGAFLLTRGGGRDPLAVCKPHDELAGVWDAATRSAAEAAFVATGAPLAADNWSRVTKTIDAWSGRWASGRVEACLAHAGGKQSGELHDRRITCLDRQRNRLSALADLFRKPDAALVRESVMAAAALPEPEDCADAEALLAQSPAPADPTVRHTVALIWAQLDNADTLNTVGRYADATKMIESAQAAAAKIDYRPLHAQILYALGVTRGQARDLKVSEELFRKAADAAAAARNAPLYARCLNQLVWIVGAMQQRFDDAAPLRVFATQAVHLAGDDPGLLVELNLHGGAVDLMHGDSEAALPQFERSLALVEEKHGKHSVHGVAQLNLIGVTYAALGKNDEAAAAYQRALTILETTVSPKHPRVAGLLGNLGNIAMGKGKYDEAEDYQRRALAIAEATSGPESSEAATALNNLAQPIWAREDFDEAFKLIDRARVLWEKAFGPDHSYVASALTNLGGLRQQQKRCAEALPYLDRALAIMAKKGLPAAMPTIFKGACLVDLGRAAEALPLIEAALRINEAGHDPQEVARARFELARALWATGRDRKRAVTLATQAKDTYAAAGIDSDVTKITTWLAGKVGR